MGLFESILLATGFVLIGLSLRFLSAFFGQAKERLKIKKLGFETTPDSPLLETQFKPKFFALKRIDYRKPFFKGKWQGREIEFCKAINRVVGESYLDDEKLLIALNDITEQLPKTIISSRSLRLLSTIPVTKLSSLDLINYPSFKRKFSVQTEHEGEFFRIISDDVLRAIEMIDDVTIEFNDKQAVFLFTKRNFNSSEIKGALDEALKVIEMIEISKEWRTHHKG